VVEVEAERERFFLSLNNTGRLEQFLSPGRKVFFLSRSHHRKTVGSLVAVEDGEGVALLDTQWQMQAFEQALKDHRLPWLPQGATFTRHPRLPQATLDYCLRYGDKRLFLELKSAVYRKGDLALYPDAPTERGRRQVRVLQEICQSGEEAYFVFIAPLTHITGCSLFVERDPALAALLGEASREGVKVRAVQLACAPTGEVFLLHPDLPVYFPEMSSKEGIFFSHPRLYRGKRARGG